MEGGRTFTGPKGVSKVWKCKKYSVQGLREARFMKRGSRMETLVQLGLAHMTTQNIAKKTLIITP